MKFNFFLSKNNRKIQDRKKILKSLGSKKIKISSLKNYYKFGRSYFDDYNIGIGYGGYKDDGRFNESASKFIKFFKLKKNSKVLEIGCAKGYLLSELKKKGMKIFGIDISKYAAKHSNRNIRKNIKILNVEKGIPFKDNFFDLVISKDTIPLIKLSKINMVIREIMRVSKNKKNIYLHIQGVKNVYQSNLLKKWEPTTKISWTSKQWQKKLTELNFKGFYEIKNLF